MTRSKQDIGAIVHKHGVSFRVWAPFAQSVAVTGSFNNWGRTPLSSEGDGYWAGEDAAAVAGQEYKYVITNNGQELFKNDPRSLQVTTNDGNSVIVDTQYDWSDQDFMAPPVNQQVIYEMHIGTFSRADASTAGTFATAAEKLPYLAQLGINMIELMPICSMSSDRGWGYAPDYIYAVESLYGGRHEFLKFVDAAHTLGIGVVLDVVYNHFGPDEKLDIWQFDGWNQDGKGGIYFYNDWRSSTPWGETRPDYGRPEVRQYILDNVKLWLNDCHVDGLRLDSTIYLRNVKGFNNDTADDIAEGWSLMQQINQLACKIKPNAVMIAEDAGGNEYITKSQAEGGAGFSAQWELGVPHVMREAFDATNDAGRNLGGIREQITHSYNGQPFQRIVYSDSHDTAANGGARLDEEISPGNAGSVYARRRSLLASAIVLTMPGVPMLLQGQEFMQGGSFNDWEELDWENAERYQGIVEAHTHLIDLRKNKHGNTAGLTGSSVAILHEDDTNNVLAYHRWQNGGPGDDVVVVVNVSNKVLTDYQLHFPRSGEWQVRFNSDWKGYSPDFKNTASHDVVVDDNKVATIEIGPYSTLIFSQQ